MHSGRTLRRSPTADVVAALTLLTACSASPRSTSSPTAAPAKATAITTTAPSDPPARTDSFAAVRDRIVDEWLRRNPSRARELGLHEFDAKLADYSETGIRASVEWLRAANAALEAFDPAKLSPDDRLDRAMLLRQIGLDLFRMVDLETWKRQPQYYEELFSVNGYLDRDYAPIEERAKKLVLHEQAALAEVAHITKNLGSPLSKPIVETAIKIYKGYADYLRVDVVKMLSGVGDAQFRAQFAATNEALAAKASDLAEHLRTVELPKGDASHVLGRARFAKLLAIQEGIAAPLAEFKKMGESDLAANKRAYEEARKRAKPTRPTAGELLGVAAQLTENARAFIVDKRLVTIPTEDRAMPKETPPYMRWNSAFLDAPGPFERAKNAFYYITMPDPSWPKKEQREYVPVRGVLLATTVHEVYPGHYLQGQWIRRAPTRVQKMFDSYSFVEGWAHYGEQMMIEQGFGGDDPQNKLGQLSDALLRNCRYVVSVGVHAEGMSLDAAEKRFATDCFQDKATAREQAVRATFDPGYFAYTVGKLQILSLRDEAKRRLGDRFDLRRFHDALLSHGSPPVPYIRDRVLDELAADESDHR